MAVLVVHGLEVVDVGHRNPDPDAGPVEALRSTASRWRRLNTSVSGIQGREELELVDGGGALGSRAWRSIEMSQTAPLTKSRPSRTVTLQRSRTQREDAVIADQTVLVLDDLAVAPGAWSRAATCRGTPARRRGAPGRRSG